MNSIKHKIKYISSDILANMVAWTLFVIYRQVYIIADAKPIYFSEKYILGIILLPFFWVTLHLFSGYYKDIYRKSRQSEFWNTFFITLIGSIILFFSLILDDYIYDYQDYYYTFIALFVLQFIITYIPRLIITSKTQKKIRLGEIGFNTLIIGSNKNACNYFELLNKKPRLSGNSFIGFINVKKNIFEELKQKLPHLGNLDNLVDIIQNYKIEEIIIAIESEEKNIIEKILTKLPFQNLVIKTTPNVYDVITGSVKISSIYGVPLMELNRNLMPTWEQSLKRLMDFCFSLFAIIILLPVYFIVALGVVLTSKGCVFYSHERIGLHGKPFTIYKFRSMVDNAETDGPKLSSENDPRITKFGKFLRKTRLDEIPQFYNVLIGDMSLVGPRPERLFYIKKIAEKNPLCYRIYKVRPGITSWSAIKIGYTETIDQMTERLNFDLIYIENMSIMLDIKILLHTILTVFRGEGK